MLAAGLGAEELYRVLQTVVVLAYEVLQAYGDTLIQQAPEGFTAVFGVPVAQEDHARCAVLAALALQQRFVQHPTLHPPGLGAGPALGLGIHSGLGVVGAWGPGTMHINLSTPRKLLWHYRVATHTIMPVSQELPYDDHTTGGPCDA